VAVLAAWCEREWPQARNRRYHIAEMFQLWSKCSKERSSEPFLGEMNDDNSNPVRQTGIVKMPKRGPGAEKAVILLVDEDIQPEIICMPLIRIPRSAYIQTAVDLFGARSNVTVKKKERKVSIYPQFLVRTCLFCASAGYCFATCRLRANYGSGGCQQSPATVAVPTNSAPVSLLIFWLQASGRVHTPQLSHLPAQLHVSIRDFSMALFESIRPPWPVSANVPAAHCLISLARLGA